MDLFGHHVSFFSIEYIKEASTPNICSSPQKHTTQSHTSRGEGKKEKKQKNKTAEFGV